MANTMDGLSMNIEQANMDKLKAVFPECFAEGKLDIDKLLSLCGEYIDNDFEKYKFEWKGKAECLRLAQKRSTGTLRPCPEESVNFDTTQNLYIEGDNLEVLKLLQTAYYRKVKMIYIDPPYNTGNDFVYEDDFADPMARYKEVTRQTTKSNPETMGRYHTNWLNMMYPRLRLAANLLCDDGVIFISIDNNEVFNLKKICDEVFGEENFVDSITWNTRIPKNDNKGLGNIHQFILVYVKSNAIDRKFTMQKDGLEEVFELLDKLKKQQMPIPEAEEELKKFYAKKDFDRGITLYNSLDENYQPWGKINMSWPNGDTFGPKFDVYHPATKKPTKVPDRGWRWNQDTFNNHLDYNNVITRYDGSYICGDIWFAKDETTQPSSIKYLKDVSKMLLRTIISLKSDGGVELEDIFGKKSYFSNPKPTSLLTLLLNSIEEKDYIVLDFFSGSATTAHAVMQLNAEDGGNRKFIMVQLPEVCDEKSEAYKAGYKNICEIGKERIRRAGKKLTETDGQIKLGEEAKQPLDVGFKVYKLDTSNLKTWDAAPIEDDDLLTLYNRMNGMIHRVKPDRTDLDMVYEIMLKLGVPLTYSVQKIALNVECGVCSVELDDAAKSETPNSKLQTSNLKTAYAVGDDCLLLICLAENVQPEDVETMAEYAPAKIIISRDSFADDTAMSNAYYILRDRSIELKLV